MCHGFPSCKRQWKPTLFSTAMRLVFQSSTFLQHYVISFILLREVSWNSKFTEIIELRNLQVGARMLALLFSNKRHVSGTSWQLPSQCKEYDQDRYHIQQIVHNGQEDGRCYGNSLCSICPSNLF